MKKIEIFCAGSLPKYQPYMAKLEEVLQQLNVDYQFNCWLRKSTSQAKLDDQASSRVKSLYYNGYEGSKWLVLHYLVWMLKIFFYTLTQFPKDNIAFVSRIDSALPFYLAAKLRNLQYVFLDRDCMHLSYKWPAPLKRLIKYIETKVAAAALKHVIPGQSRNFTHKDNVVIIPNSPHSITLQKAQAIASTLRRDDALTVYINGWLKPTRGIGFIAEAVEKLSQNANIKFIVAGEVASPEGQRLISLSNVNYLGNLDNAQALAYYYISDIILAFYDPSLEINRKAEPNKWFDCLMLNKLFITNSEIETAQIWLEKECCLGIEYNDSDALVTKLQYFAANRHELEKMVNKVAKFTIEPWDTAMRELISQLT